MQAVGSPDRRSAGRGSRLNVWARAPPESVGPSVAPAPRELPTGRPPAVLGAPVRPGGCTPPCHASALHVGLPVSTSGRRSCARLSAAPLAAAAAAAAAAAPPGRLAFHAAPPRRPPSDRSGRLLVCFTKKLNHSHATRVAASTFSNCTFQATEQSHRWMD
jgi:hypothetical protein